MCVIRRPKFSLTFLVVSNQKKTEQLGAHSTNDEADEDADETRIVSRSIGARNVNVSHAASYCPIRSGEVDLRVEHQRSDDVTDGVRDEGDSGIDSFLRVTSNI
jgi:hypothetical protein